MERLKAILADKILDLSSSNGDDVKMKIDKMQRFRDFANACQTLMIKYPQIEEELIKMIKDGDFDTKVASSRVDSVIRLADSEAAQIKSVSSQAIEPEYAVNGVSENFIIEEKELSELPVVDPVSVSDTLLDREALIGSMEAEEEPLLLPEDVDYEELHTTPEEETEKGYVPYENLLTDEIVLSDTETEPNFSEQKNNIEQEDTNLNEEELAAAKQKATIRKVIQIVGVILAVVVLIFIIKFVMNHWQTILIIIGIAAVVAALVVWLKRKQS